MKKILLLSIAATLTLTADPFSTYIGTKAKGMGGAFTAVSNNNSAMYFNPAGLVNFEGLSSVQFTLEGGSGAKFNQYSSTIEDKFDTSTSYFIGASVISPDYGFGVAIYSLYDLEMPANDSYNTHVLEEITITSISGAYKLSDTLYPSGGALSIGATAAYATNYSEEIYDDGTVQAGFSGGFLAVGLKMRALNQHALKIDLGINYRSGTTLSGSSDMGFGGQGVGIPEEIAYGVAVIYGTQLGVFTLALDYKETGYAEATNIPDFNIAVPDFNTMAAGLDYSTTSFQARVGLYNSKYDESGVAGDSISGYTMGLGYVFNETFNVEASYDNRTYTFPDTETSTAFTSFALNITI